MAIHLKQGKKQYTMIANLIMLSLFIRGRTCILYPNYQLHLLSRAMPCAFLRDEKIVQNKVIRSWATR